MFTLKELEDMAKKCLEYPEQMNLDIESAQTQIYVAVKDLYYVMRFPEHQTKQKQYEELMNSTKPMIMPSDVPFDGNYHCVHCGKVFLVAEQDEFLEHQMNCKEDRNGQRR